MGNEKNATLTASIVTDASGTKLVLKDAGGNVNPPVSFNKNAKNKLTISCNANSGFCFAGFNIYGVNATDNNPNAAAAAALNKFEVSVEPTSIIIKDKIKDNTQVLNFEYTIYAQKADGTKLADDPRIINQTS